LTGMGDPFEEPLNPELVVDTEHHNVAQTTDQVVAYLERERLLPAPARA
jgi:adenylylsulfate kinase